VDGRWNGVQPVSAATYTFTVVAKVKVDKPLTRDQKRAAVKRYKEEAREYFEDDVDHTISPDGPNAVATITSVTIV